MCSMSKHDDLVRLQHMLEHASEAVRLAEGKNRSDLDNSRVLALALVRLLEVVGEAASRVSKATQRQYPKIPWPQMIGMRNRLVHDYVVIDVDIVWQTVVEELPSLVAELERIVPPE